MASKIKQSVAVERQIPQHIKDNYPLFVEFIKLYYDYLQETQQQNLEQVRDIDTVLDEFIDRFKSELARNFPIDLVNDKALILKHLREFYLSRGSEDSYKFLFRVLFNKEAELFYPSVQMLRVSDGKWKQDVSIFVKTSGTTEDLFPINGKFINIIVSESKTIVAFVENVLQYSGNVYEVFIARDYVNEVEVGSSISYLDEDDVEYTGVIQLCPTKVSVYKKGKGFKVGDIFSLNTNLGRGCVVKVTKVDADGGILAVNVIRFGLDYVTTFYSYLSNKDLQGVEYVHPAQINHPYNPAEPHYNENSGGFIDYGFASKQTYFFYDQNIPVGVPGRESDRFFAESSYVGDVVQQFYTDGSKEVLDEDLAIIQVDVGAAARYPGYYMTVDGFISDEMYIQDGRYYQAYSYVVRVEEELRKYADIVKALVHPAGMKIFSEYRIFNLLQLSAVTGRVSKILQLPEAGRPPSTVFVDDRGYGYTSYDSTIIGNEVVITPTVGATRVFAKQGKASLHNIKRHADDLSIVTVKNKSLSKEYADIITELSLQYKAPVKNIADVINQYVEVVAKGDLKRLADTATTVVTKSKAFEKIKTDVQIILDSQSKLMSKPFADSITSITDDKTLSFAKNLSEFLSTSETLSKGLSKALADTVLTLDNAIRVYQKAVSDNQTVSDSQAKTMVKALADIQIAIDQLSNAFTKNLSDTVSNISDSLAKNFTKDKQDSITTPTDLAALATVKAIQDQLAQQIDLLSTDVTKALSDIVNNFVDSANVQPIKNFSDIVSTPLDAKSLDLNKVFDSVTSLTDYIESVVSIALSELIALTEVSYLAVDKNIDDTQIVQDTLSKDSSKYHIDEFTPEDLLSNRPIKNIDDSIPSQTDFAEVVAEKILSDSTSHIDSLSYFGEKNISTNVSAIELLSNALTRLLADTVSLTDGIEIIRTLYFEETLSAQDFFSIVTQTKTFTELLSVLEQYSPNLVKPLSETLSLVEFSNKEYAKNHIETLTLIESSTKTPIKIIDEILTLSEAYTKAYGKNLSEVLPVLEANSKSLTRAYSESINITNEAGKIATAPYDYDNELFFKVGENYQPTLATF